MTTEDPIDIDAIKINPADPTLVTARGRPRGAHKAQPYYVKVPWTWLEKLEGASGQTRLLALYLLRLTFRRRSTSITLANRTLEEEGISLPSQSKRRSLRDLEGRGLVRVEWRPKKSPIVHVLAG